MQMSVAEFTNSDEFENYVGDVSTFNNLPPERRTQIIVGAAKLFGVTLTPPGGFENISEIDSSFEDS